ncbi:MAG: sulfatase [Haloquadratum sp.]|nr:sulfatase [Haloferacaceae archaeon]MDR9445890.1 sulfatase [Haloquadratum sp.]
MTRQPPSAAAPAGEPTAESAILITVDSLRADAVDLDTEGLTPSMARLAAEGTLCTNAFAGGNWTPFSFPSILASSPVFTRDGDIGVAGADTLASVLSDAGFTTAGFNAANGFLTSHWGYDHGFDHFEPHVTAGDSSLYGRYLATHPTVEAWLQLATAPMRRLRSMLSGTADSRPFLDTSRMFAIEESAQRFIRETDGPFFLWLHYMDAHTPYVPAPRYIRDVSAARIGTHRMLLAHTRTGLGREVAPRTLRDLQNLYRAAIRQVDLSIGRVLETLGATGKLASTAVVLAGDHGEEFQEHGHLAHYPKLYDELIHVPLIVHAPGRSPGVDAAPIGLDAIPPTVTSLLGVDPAPAWEGRPVGVDGDAPVVSVTVRGEEITSQPIPRTLDDGRLLLSARTADYVYITDPAAGHTELYDRRADPYQQTDLLPTDDAELVRVRDRLAAAVSAHAVRLGGVSPADARPADPDVEARLSALGYR